MKNDNIILIGMPGVGKTTIGKRIAKSAQLQFIDTDRIIEEKTGKKIPSLIAEHGIDAFLEIENSICAKLNIKNAVIATGGSVIYGKDAMKHFSQIGTIIYLKLPLPLLRLRLHDLNARGVVLRGSQTLHDIFRERTPLYEKYADITINERNCYPNQTATRTRLALEEFGFFKNRTPADKPSDK